MSRFVNMFTNAEQRTQRAAEKSREEISAFLESTREDFAAAFRAVDTSGDVVHTLSVESIASRALRRLFSPERLNDFLHKGNSTELVGVLHRAVVDRTVVLHSPEDVRLLYFILSAGFGQDADAIAHYISTGEVMEVMGAVNREFGRGGRDRIEEHARRSAQKMLRRLYGYDMSLDEHEEIPLEIRMSFAGCFDDETKRREA